jgi:hypothetical protein
MNGMRDWPKAALKIDVLSKATKNKDRRAFHDAVDLKRLLIEDFCLKEDLYVFTTPFVCKNVHFFGV